MCEQFTFCTHHMNAATPITTINAITKIGTVMATVVVVLSCDIFDDAWGSQKSCMALVADADALYNPVRHGLHTG